MPRLDPVFSVEASAGRTVSSTSNGTCFLDELVEDEVEFTVRKGKTPLGLISEISPTWTWHVGALGQVKWVISPVDIPGRLNNDPPWYSSFKSMRSGLEDGVKILLLQGDWARVPKWLWESDTLEFVIQVSDELRWTNNYNNHKSCKGERHLMKKRRLDVPQSWKITEMVVTH